MSRIFSVVTLNRAKAPQYSLLHQLDLDEVLGDPQVKLVIRLYLRGGSHFGIRQTRAGSG